MLRSDFQLNCAQVAVQSRAVIVEMSRDHLIVVQFSARDIAIVLLHIARF